MIIMGTSRQRARSSDGLSVHVEVPGGPHPPRWYERPEPDSCWGRRAPWPTCTPAVGWTSRGGVDGETYRGNESSRRVIASRLSPRGRRLSFSPIILITQLPLCLQSTSLARPSPSLLAQSAPIPRHAEQTGPGTLPISHLWIPTATVSRVSSCAG